MTLNSILVTGGAGFIGSALIRHLIRKTNYQVINVDNLTYAGNLSSLKSCIDNDQYRFEKVDICDASAIRSLLKKYKPESIMHLAAESHVDRSIESPGNFIKTNVLGTYTLLEEARLYWCDLQKNKRENFRFHHISTDEVYGDLPHPNENKNASNILFTETSAYSPSSPYSASKASSDHLVRAWCKTYGLPILITNCSNNYGPYQFPEKLIPLCILNTLEGKQTPVYGSGTQIRDWLFVEDHVEALIKVLIQGNVGETYNIGGNDEKTNLEVIQSIVKICNEEMGLNNNYLDLINYVDDRPGHDRRYAIDNSKICNRLDWEPRHSFEEGIRKTIRWYVRNRGWCQSVKDGSYQGERLGIIKKGSSI